MNRKERRQNKHLDKIKRVKKKSDFSKSDQLIQDAQICIDNGEIEEAKSLLIQSKEISPLRCEPYHILALLAYSEGRLVEAGELILEATTRNEDDSIIHANCGAIMNLLGRSQEAEAACRHAIDLDSLNAEPYNNLAVSLEVQGRLDEAQESAIRAIELNPQYLEACINLGNILLRSGDPLKAIEAYRAGLKVDITSVLGKVNLAIALRETDQIELAEKECLEALEINPKFPEGYNCLGTLLKEKEDWKGSIKAFEKAIELRGLYVDAKLNLAAVLFKSGDFQGSQIKYKEIIDKLNDLPEAYSGLGVVNLGLGNIDDAIENFKKSILIKPTLGIAQYNLATAIGGDYSEIEINKINELIKDKTLSITDRTLIYFALGEINDKKGNYEIAFSNFSKGNQLLKNKFEQRKKGFDAIAFDRRVDRLMATYNASFFTNHNFVGNSSDTPVFIVGMPRSGTTLVEQIIASHSSVVGKGELDLISTICGDDLELASASNEILEKKANSYLDELNKDVKGVGKIIDKMPFNWFYMGQIQLLFPNAQIIYCRRDNLDTSLSCFFQHFTAPHAWACDLTNISLFQNSASKFMNHIQNESSLRIKEVFYEELVENQEFISRSILKFLGLDWEERCLRFHDSKRMVQTASSWQVRKPIFKKSIGRSKKYESIIKSYK